MTILKEYTKPDTQGKNRKVSDIQCDICDTVVTRQTRQITDVEGKHSCSAACRNILNGSVILTDCDRCGNTFRKKKSSFVLSKSGKYFCSRTCKDVAQKYMTEIQPDHYGVGGGRYDYRERALEHYGEKCNRCGYSDNILALDVHHKDRDRDNNELVNLEVLCCNCHAIEHRRKRT